LAEGCAVDGMMKDASPLWELGFSPDSRLRHRDHEVASEVVAGALPEIMLAPADQSRMVS